MCECVRSRSGAPGALGRSCAATDTLVSTGISCGGIRISAYLFSNLFARIKKKTEGEEVRKRDSFVESNSRTLIKSN